MEKIVLYIWPGVDGLISMSPFSLKVVLAAKVKGLTVEVKHVIDVPRWVITGKLPAAMINEQPVCDSTNIMKRLDQIQSDKPLLYPAEPALRADVVILEDWADESLFWYVVEYRFKNKQNFREFSRKAFGKLVFPLRQLVPRMLRKTSISRTKAQGIGCLSEQDRDANFNELCQSLEQKLAGRSYFVGSYLTAADIAIYAQLKQITHAKLDPACAMIAACPNLMDFIERIDQIHLP